MSTVRHVRRTSHSDVTIDTESNPRFRIMTIVIRVSNSQYHDVLIYLQRCSLMMLNETKTQLTCSNRKPIQASIAAAVRSMLLVGMSCMKVTDHNTEITLLFKSINWTNGLTYLSTADSDCIDLITVSAAILAGRQSGSK